MPLPKQQPSSSSAPSAASSNKATSARARRQPPNSSSTPHSLDGLEPSSIPFGTPPAKNTRSRKSKSTSAVPSLADEASHQPSSAEDDLPPTATQPSKATHAPMSAAASGDITPSKRSRRSRPNRQCSPPASSDQRDLAAGDTVGETEVEGHLPLARPPPIPLSSAHDSSLPPAADVSTDPYANNPAMSLLSRSAPSLGLLPLAASPRSTAAKSPLGSAASSKNGRGSKPQSHLQQQFHSMSADESSWDMPAIPVHAARAASGSNEGLTWQQASFQSSPSGSNTPSRNKSDANGNGNNKRTGRQSRGQNQQQQPEQQQQQIHQPRPTLNTSASDSAAAPAFASSSPTLNWQQRELLSQRSGSAASGHSASFSGDPQQLQLYQHASNISGNGTGSVNTPQRNRRSQLRDAQTFGLEAPSSSPQFSLDDLFSPLSSPSLQHGRVQSHSMAQSGSRSPTKGTAMAAVEARYAGPTFHNSPEPSALPIPSFMIRRQMRQLSL